MNDENKTKKQLIRELSKIKGTVLFLVNEKLEPSPLFLTEL